MFSALQQNSELSCIWKLIADNCSLVTKLPEKYCCLLVPVEFFTGEPQPAGGSNKILEKDDLYVLAARYRLFENDCGENEQLHSHEFAIARFFTS